MADFGALAAGFARSFVNARNNKKDRELDDKYKKAMTLMLETQIEQAQHRQSATSQVADLMSPQTIAATPPEFAFPPEGQLGEIQTTKPAGPTVKPGMSFMDIMSDPGGRIAMAESGLAEQMQKTDQMVAQSELVRAMQSSGAAPLEFLQSKEGGALAVRAGMNPSEFLRMQQAGAGDELNGLRADLLALDATGKRRDAETAEREANQHRISAKNTINRGIEQAGEITDLATKLEGTFLEAGLPASTWRRTGAAALAGIGGALGMDVSELEKDLGHFDELKKNLSDQLINLMSSGDLGNGTNSKLQQYQNALASTETSVPAIMAIQAKIVQALLDDADVQSAEVENRPAAEAAIKKWRAYEPPKQEATVDAPAIAARIAEIGKMGMDELRALQSSVAEMTPEMLEAAAARWDEINSAAARR